MNSVCRRRTGVQGPQRPGPLRWLQTLLASASFTSSCVGYRPSCASAANQERDLGRQRGRLLFAPVKYQLAAFQPTRRSSAARPRTVLEPGTSGYRRPAQSAMSATPSILLLIPTNSLSS
jgi:hypothetical protein